MYTRMPMSKILKVKDNQEQGKRTEYLTDSNEKMKIFMYANCVILQSICSR
jgi:hypothetical protein